MPLSDAKLLMQQEHYKEALRVAQLALWSGELSALDCADAHYLMGKAQLLTGQYFAAAHSLNRARQSAIELGTDSVGPVELDLGTAYLYLGDLAEAAQMLESGLARPALAACKQAGAMYNLAVIHQEQNRYADAICFYNVARDLDRQAGNSRSELDGTLSIAWCHLLQGQAQAAKPVLDEVNLLAPFMPGIPVADLSCPHQALYFRLCGNLPLSMQLCQQAMDTRRLQSADYHLTVGEAAWIAGQNALDLEHYAESRMLAQQALQHGLNLQWPSLLNRANKLRRQAERALQRN